MTQSIDVKWKEQHGILLQMSMDMNYCLISMKMPVEQPGP